MRKEFISRKAFLTLAGALAMAAVMAEPTAAAPKADAAPVDTIRVGSYNIRLSPGDRGTANAWDKRRGDVVALIKKMNLDAFGLQEVCPDQAAYLRESLPDYAFVGEHREADRKSGEASPVAYRKDRFEAEQSGTFWLSETPEVPGVKGWGAACPRVCSYLVLKEKATGKRFCFANCHTDHVSALAREKGMLLIIERMKKFGAGLKIVFTGDHNCLHEDAPAVAVRKLLSDARDVSEKRDPGPASSCLGFSGKPRFNQDGTERVQRIDYIYVTPGTKVLDFETYGDKRPGLDLCPSDHFPVAATIEL